MNLLKKSVNLLEEKIFFSKNEKIEWKELKNSALEYDFIEGIQFKDQDDQSLFISSTNKN